ncbi:hypothetical protein KPSA1_07108 [Pseudomonas syringae pv. actinidiae]|uniref:Uncharacterized protein n=1 Tax=Pseudomonas syringae pv. actinidiae TaxID=103796 RepID=A0A2V0QSH6_PSESF|nr:hypothetical protein KPSA1_07108 [Pseudomonas syringae pv. actinidiae]
MPVCEPGDASLACEDPQKIMAFEPLLSRASEASPGSRSQSQHFAVE